MAAKRSRWIAFVELFLLWTGGRAIYTAVLYELDPNYRVAAVAGYGPVLLGGEVLFGVLAIGAAVAIYVRYRHALMMATAALGLYTALSSVGILQATTDLPAAREAYKASREARGFPVTEERLDMMFRPESIPMLWVIAAALCIPPYVILLWRRHELNPHDDDLE
jgi:hypothetical protein